MNKAIIAEHFSKAIPTYPREANVRRQIADKTIRLSQKYIPSPCLKAVEFGCGTDIHSRILLRTPRLEELPLNDLCPEMRYCCEDLSREKQASFLSGDAETIPLLNKSMLITPCSALQWFESPEEFFKRCNTLFHSQGCFVFSTFGKKNMKETCELTGKGLPYRSKKEPEVALFFHLDILYPEEELIPLSLEDPMKVLYHLKQMGMNGLPAQSSPYSKHEEQI